MAPWAGCSNDHDTHAYSLSLTLGKEPHLILKGPFSAQATGQVRASQLGGVYEGTLRHGRHTLHAGAAFGAHHRRLQARNCTLGRLAHHKTPVLVLLDLCSSGLEQLMQCDRTPTRHPYDQRLLFRLRLLCFEEPEEHPSLVDLHDAQTCHCRSSICRLTCCLRDKHARVVASETP